MVGRCSATAESLTLVHGEDGLGVAQRGRAQVNHVDLLRSRVLLLQAGHVDEGLVAGWRIILVATGQHGRLTLHVLLLAAVLQKGLLLLQAPVVLRHPHDLLL